jgi:protein TonB
MTGDYEERGFFQRFGFITGIGAVAAVASVFIFTHHSGPDLRAIHPPEIVMVHPLLPTPLPPTPPPEPPKEIVQKMIEQTPMDQPEDKPDAPKDPGPALTTNVVGSGSDAFGLGSGSGGGGSGGRSGPHSRFGWYAGQVQRLVQEALSRNRATSLAEFTDRVKIWADATGRVTRVKLERSTGNDVVDQAINQALDGLQLEEPPPADMPMPITMRIIARRRT